MENRLFKILLGGTILTGLLAFTLIAFVDRPLDDETNNIKQQVFNQAMWLKYAGTMDRDSPRGAMVKDLRQKLFSKPYSRKEIVKLLGEPDMSSSESMLSYHLGMWSDNRRTTDSMDLYFDFNDRLQKVELAQH